MYERFASFDLTGTGFLTRHEIQEMMAKLGYAANDRYLSDLLGLFGSFDKDGDGCVDFEEWKELWAHLGGEDAMGETDGAKKSEANAHEESDPLSYEKFCFADWQIVRMGPCEWEFTTPQIGIVPGIASLIGSMKEYCSNLCKIKPEIESEYPVRGCTGGSSASGRERWP